MDRQVPRSRQVIATLVRLRASMPKLVIESVMIAFGVLLAFGIDSWKAQNKLERDTTVVLQNLQNELISNRSILLEWMSYHDTLLVRLDEQIENQSATFDFVKESSFEKLVAEPNISYLLQSTAWQTAHSTKVVSYFEYLTTYNLTHCYESHEQITQTRDFLFAKMHEQVDTNESSRMNQLTILKSLIQTLSKQEHYLLSVYRDALIEVDNELTASAKN
ncbi:DUF6090 family protein [Roseivirga sp. E12]|uniref:DUF6090 family protein n=1 Tax=Roseivirga sp. E12 TaxID=2819237 RepID=UPI001ABC0B59|nr:DUF6090 family protein [Roseivirga sp. E12]MBO3700419.1 hypothetical protein [Roseivirga sp. E12]